MPAKCPLLTCIPDLFAALSPLGCGQATQVAILTSAQCAFSAHLLTCVQLLLTIIQLDRLSLRG